LIGKIEKSATLNGTTWVTIEDFEGHGKILEIWAKIPADIGTGTTVLIGLFSLNQLTDGDERYKSAGLAENGTRMIRFITESATDFPLALPYVRGDLLKMKSDDAATKVVEFIIYCEE
jgi:hypothetical protein